MLANLLFPLLLAAGPAGVLAAPSSAPVQEEEIPDKRPEIKEKLKALRDHVKQRGKEDQEAIALIEELIAEFPKSGPSDRASIVDGVQKCLEVKRKDLDKGVPDNRLFLTTAIALGRMGPESVKPLSKWIGHKKHRDDLQVQRELILSLGKTRDEDGVKPLLDCLDNHDPAIVAAGAEALGDFDGASEKTRKHVFEELLKQLMSAKGAMDSDVNDIIARERYDVVSAPIITSLQRLSGHDERQPEGWQRWWNKNKKNDWEKKEG